MTLTGESLDSLIVSNDCIVELNVPLIYVVSAMDEISRKEGELLLLLPHDVKFQDSIVGQSQNNIYNHPRKPPAGRLHLREKYGIKGVWSSMKVDIFHGIGFIMGEKAV